MWQMSRIGDLDYEIEHRSGIDNDDADSVSRHPMLGVRSIVRIGADIALEELLKSFTGPEKDIAKWWVSTARQQNWFPNRSRGKTAFSWFGICIYGFCKHNFGFAKLHSWFGNCNQTKKLVLQTDIAVLETAFSDFQTATKP